MPKKTHLLYLVTTLNQEKKHFLNFKQHICIFLSVFLLRWHTSVSFFSAVIVLVVQTIACMLLQQNFPVYLVYLGLLSPPWIQEFRPLQAHLCLLGDLKAPAGHLRLKENKFARHLCIHKHSPSCFGSIKTSKYCWRVIVLGEYFLLLKRLNYLPGRPSRPGSPTDPGSPGSPLSPGLPAWPE